MLELGFIATAFIGDGNLVVSSPLHVDVIIIDLVAEGGSVICLTAIEIGVIAEIGELVVSVVSFDVVRLSDNAPLTHRPPAPLPDVIPAARENDANSPLAEVRPPDCRPSPFCGILKDAGLPKAF